jgi:hypothetical protein
MTEKEMIEELAHTLYCKQDKFDLSNPFEVAKAVVEEGYSKIPKEAIIQVPEKFCFQDKEFDMQVMYMARSTYDFVLAQARKETVREFSEKLKASLEDCSMFENVDIEQLEFDGETIKEVLYETAKQFGVEVE